MKISSYRIPVYIRAELFLDTGNCEVVIINLSESGACIENDPLVNKFEIPKDRIIQLEFLTPGEEVIRIHCRVVWSRKTEEKGDAHHLGVEFTEIPPEYDDYFRSLYVSNMRSL